MPTTVEVEIQRGAMGHRVFTVTIEDRITCLMWAPGAARLLLIFGQELVPVEPVEYRLATDATEDDAKSAAIRFASA